jgi:hypothetical protein
MLYKFKNYNLKNIINNKVFSIKLILLVTILTVILFPMLSGIKHTLAKEVASVNLYIKQEKIAPGSNNTIDLFKQLNISINYVIKDNGTDYITKEVFAGKMSEWTDYLFIAKVISGEDVKLDFVVSLPGKETGNEFQGLETRTKFLIGTTCTLPNGQIIDCPVKITSGQELFNIKNMVPGDSFKRRMTFTVSDIPQVGDGGSGGGIIPPPIDDGGKDDKSKDYEDKKYEDIPEEITVGKGEIEEDKTGPSNSGENELGESEPGKNGPGEDETGENGPGEDSSGESITGDEDSKNPHDSSKSIVRRRENNV